MRQTLSAINSGLAGTSMRRAEHKEGHAWGYVLAADADPGVGEHTMEAISLL